MAEPMGDRANIVVRQGKDNRDDVWFYTHWSGSEIGETVKRALGRNERWNDPAYLARIIFCELIKGAETSGIGFGISTQIGDNEHDILVVDIPKQLVYEVTEKQLEDGRLAADPKMRRPKTFGEVIAAPVNSGRAS